MKATRKLIPAIAMLLISAVMMSTATFAWFTTNGTVSADGITISAKANTTYLLISDETTFEGDLSDLTTISLTGVTGIKYPVKWAGDYTTAKWQKAVGTDFDDGTAKGSYSDVTDTTEYVLTTKLYVKIANGYDPAKDLKLTSATVTGGSQAAAVVVKCGSNYNWTTGGNGATPNNETVLATDVTPDNYLTLEVFVYIDGDHEDVTNANFEKNLLANLGIALTFEVGETPVTP